MDARFVIMMVMGVLLMGWVVFCGIQFIRHSRNLVAGASFTGHVKCEKSAGVQILCEKVLLPELSTEAICPGPQHQRDTGRDAETFTESGRSLAYHHVCGWDHHLGCGQHTDAFC